MEPLIHYFDAEKYAGLLCLALGITALVFATWLFRAGGAFRVMVYPVALIGVMQLALGGGLYARTDSQVETLVTQFAKDRGAARDAEITRMAVVNRNFLFAKAGEALLIAISVIVVMVASRRAGPVGVSLGLLMQASVMLVFDVFAEQRALEYFAWLESLKS